LTGQTKILAPSLAVEVDIEGEEVGEELEEGGGGGRRRMIKGESVLRCVGVNR